MIDFLVNLVTIFYADPLWKRGRMQIFREVHNFQVFQKVWSNFDVSKFAKIKDFPVNYGTILNADRFLS